MTYTPFSGVVEVRGHPWDRIPYGSAVQPRTKCRIAPVLEPCKVRLVTMGEEESYYDALRWNRLVYRFVSKKSMFGLLGRPCDASDIPAHWPKVISGDYSSATDNLKPEWSRYCLRAINRRGGADLTMWRVTESCLVDHIIDYGNGELLEQRHGQLMGSPISFPILSIVNAAVNLTFLERERGRRYVDLSHVPLRVNGDDCIIGCHDADPWGDIVSYVGLSPSVGKNYVHDQVAVINSQVYYRNKFDAQTVYPEWEDCQPVNIGLLYGDGRVHGTSSSWSECTNTVYDSVGAITRELLRCDYSDKDMLLKAFIARNPSLFSTDRPWHLHEQLGGLGIPVVNDERLSSLSPGHLRVAAFLATRPSPTHKLLYATDGSTAMQSSTLAWMQECDRLVDVLGYKYEFEHLATAVEVDPMSPRLIDFLGRGSEELFSSARKDTYRQIRREAFRSTLKPMCRDKALSWRKVRIIVTNPRL